MKLHRAITLEAQGPVPVGMTLDEVIRAGKVTNPYQLFVLAHMSEFFKNGIKSASLQLETPIDFESQATSSAVMNGLKAMESADHVNLAKYLKDCIKAGECALHDKQLDIVDWIHFVLQKQD
jgi:hypothetical protein